MERDDADERRAECERRLGALVRGGTVGEHHRVTVVDKGRLFSAHPARAIHCELRERERLLYVLYTVTKFEQTTAFRILRELYRLLDSVYGRELAAVKRSDVQGDRELREELFELVRRLERDELHELKADVGEVRDIMQSNLEAAAARGEQIDVLHQRAEELKAEADHFHHASHDASSRLWWKNFWYGLAAGLALLIFVVALVLAILFSK
eukprot:CAMPEP_0185831872 /NCGR_PEP_ID=MMETSP1353-20130828/1751_1 /TAXON_ID=1077150 /ORGANISM="Erythrolobus australicus, Strain CCMP3124" /LENGTH=209 /DNA_ID=CAMNT_0028529983 /DNA_START=203 /DNA_END=832 /DNA_ORIENTATION=+